MANSAFKICCPGNTMGCPEINPWSFPNAIKLPVNVSVPTKMDRITTTR